MKYLKELSSNLLALSSTDYISLTTLCKLYNPYIYCKTVKYIKFQNSRELEFDGIVMNVGGYSGNLITI